MDSSTHHELDILALAPPQVGFWIIFQYERPFPSVSRRPMAHSCPIPLTPAGEKVQVRCKSHKTVLSCKVSMNLKFLFFGNPHRYTPGQTTAKFSGGTRSSSTSGIAGGGRYSGCGTAGTEDDGPDTGEMGWEARWVRMRWRNGGMRGEGGVVADDAAEMETDTETEVEGVAPEREGEVDGPARGTGGGRGGASMMARRPSVGVRDRGGLRALARGTFGEEKTGKLLARSGSVTWTGRPGINMLATPFA